MQDHILLAFTGIILILRSHDVAYIDQGRFTHSIFQQSILFLLFTLLLIDLKLEFFESLAIIISSVSKAMRTQMKYPRKGHVCRNEIGIFKLNSNLVLYVGLARYPVLLSEPLFADVLLGYKMKLLSYSLHYRSGIFSSWYELFHIIFMICYIIFVIIFVDSCLTMESFNSYLLLVYVYRPV